MTDAPPITPDANVHHYRPPVSALAIVSMVSGIIAVTMLCGGMCCMFLWPLVPIGGVAAVTCGHLALMRIGRNRATGRGLAITGLVLGYIALACVLVIACLIMIEVIWPGTFSDSIQMMNSYQ